MFWLILKWENEADSPSGDRWIILIAYITGLSIGVYLNQTPLQPRERDYAYAGSFYAFAIWIGLGAAYLKKLAPLALLIPIQMASQTWDDHDRSGRYTCRSCATTWCWKGSPTAYHRRQTGSRSTWSVSTTT